MTVWPSPFYQRGQTGAATGGTAAAGAPCMQEGAWEARISVVGLGAAVDLFWRGTCENQHMLRRLPEKTLPSADDVCPSEDGR